MLNYLIRGIVIFVILFETQAIDKRLEKAIVFYDSKVIPFEVYDVKSDQKATESELISCVSWLKRLERENVNSSILKEDYLRNRITVLALDNNKVPGEIIEKAKYIVPSFKSCPKVLDRPWAFQMFERFIYSKRKNKIADQIVDCVKSLMIVDSVIKKENHPKLTKIAELHGGLIGVKYAVSYVAIDEKYKLKERVEKIIKDSAKMTKYENEYLGSKEFEKLQRSCLVFNYLVE